MLNYLPNPAAPPVDLNQLANWLKVLAEPNRLLIFHFLMEGVQCNCELGSGLQIAPNLISHHLRVLREAGLVDVERDSLDGRWMYYSINRKALEAINFAWGTFLTHSELNHAGSPVVHRVSLSAWISSKRGSCFSEILQWRLNYYD